MRNLKKIYIPIFALFLSSCSFGLKHIKEGKKPSKVWEEVGSKKKSKKTN